MLSKNNVVVMHRQSSSQPLRPEQGEDPSGVSPDSLSNSFQERDIVGDVAQLLSLYQAESDPFEREILVARLTRGLVEDANCVNPATLRAVVPLIRRDKLTSCFTSISQRNPATFDELVHVYLDEQDHERKVLYYRAILNAFSNNRDLANHIDTERLSNRGLTDALNVLEKPLAKRQGWGLLTDFFVISHAFLRRYEDVRFLPLPESMPMFRAVTQNGVTDAAERESALRFIGYRKELPFGRSSRFESSRQVIDSELQGHLHVIKAAQSDTDKNCSRWPGMHRSTQRFEGDMGLARLRYEAEVMDYLRQHREYFGLESELPVPHRGIGNRTHVWRFSDVDHLSYSVDSRYFVYLEDISEPQKLEDALLRNIGDLMRLARFGIFHTELAPIYHDPFTKRAFMWNVSGLLVGPGDLDNWTASFSYANIRESGFADDEHFDRFPHLRAVADLVNDTEQSDTLGLQHHLGNVLFTACHVLGLWFRKNERFDSDRALLEEMLERVFKGAHLDFSDVEWGSVSADIDFKSLAAEMAMFMNAQQGDRHFVTSNGEDPDLGADDGAYPIQELMKAITAFTIRAIPAYIQNKTNLRSALPSSKREKVVPSSAYFNFEPRETNPEEDFTTMIRGLLIMQTLEGEGITGTQVAKIISNLRMRDIGFATVVDDDRKKTQPVINAGGLVKAMRGVVPRSTVALLGENLRFEMMADDESQTMTLYEVASVENAWLN